MNKLEELKAMGVEVWLIGNTLSFMPPWKVKLKKDKGGVKLELAVEGKSMDEVIDGAYVRWMELTGVKVVDTEPAKKKGLLGWR